MPALPTWSSVSWQPSHAWASYLAGLVRSLVLGRLSVVAFALASASVLSSHLARLLKQATLDNYLRDLSYNDTFYYYQIARNLARGLFSTYDGVSLTNGYHPLWAWLLTPAFWLESRPEQVLPYLKAIELSVLAAAVVAIAAAFHGLKASPWLAWPALDTVLLNPNLSSGMETAPSCLALGLACLGVVRALRTPESRAAWVLCALALGLLPYARFELGLMGGLVVLGLCAYCVRARLVPRLGLRWFAACALAPMLGYLLFSQLFFHSPTPVSGMLKRYWSERSWATVGGCDVMTNLSGTIALPAHRQRLAFALAAVALAAAPWLLRRYRNQANAPSHGLDIFLLGLAASQLGQFLYAVLATTPFHSAPPWYFSSTHFLAACLPSLLLCRAFCFGAPAVVAQPAALLLALALTNHGADQRDWYFTRLKHRDGVDWEIADYHAARWIRANVPTDAVVGSSDSGVYSFFTDHRVINLDGLVNSTEYYRLQKEQRLGDWLQTRSRIEYFANASPQEWVSEGCTTLGRAMRQDAPVGGHCTLLHSGLKFQSDGSRPMKQTAIWRYEPRSLTARAPPGTLP